MNTGVTVSAVVAIGGVLWSVWSNNGSVRDELRIGLQNTHDEVRDVKEDVRALRTEINTRTDDRWRKSDMKLLMLKLQQVFPDKPMPSVD